MKAILVVLMCSIVKVVAQIPQTEEQIWSEKLEAFGNLSGIDKIKTVDDLRNASPEAAYRLFRSLTENESDAGQALVKRAGRAIAENNAVGELVRERMAKLPHTTWTSSDRSWQLKPLGYIPAPWSLRLLGQYLMDDRPLTGEVDDAGLTENPSLAAVTLSQMGFFDAPTKGRFPQIGEKQMTAWKAWWKANEGHVEQRIYEINPGYIPPQMQQPSITTTPIQTPISTPRVAPATPSPTMPTPIATLPSATPAIVAPVNRSSLLVYVIGAVFALGILFAVIKVFRK